ncbi:MAG: pirin family protein [Microthrixaceae bacterium]
MAKDSMVQDETPVVDDALLGDQGGGPEVMADPVLQTVELGPQWPTIDPFLFCAHHNDAYPASDGELGPDASLEGRDIGQDFAGVDGWNMYHGSKVPGFPVHPHRGFETVTYVRKGIIDHADSLGATARFGRGDVQWLTAGGGIQHSEMFPLLKADEPNPLELFQIWLNLPAADKHVDAYFTMLWDENVPRLQVGGEGGPTVTVTVIAGHLDGADEPLDPPPSSWASRPESDLAIWHMHFEPGSSWDLPAAVGPDTVRTLYVFDGVGITVRGHDQMLASGTGSVVVHDSNLSLSSDAGADVLMLQGAPIGEPVAKYGPFVMNHEDEIRQAFEDYQATQFGGWHWDSSDPDHGPHRGRFALHADGQVEEPPSVGSPS